MHRSVVEKLDAISGRGEELSRLLADPGVIADQPRFRSLAKELSDLKPVTECYRRYRGALEAVESAREMLGDSDPEIRELARDELGEAETARDMVEAELRTLLIPVDPADDSNTFLEIRAGAGGEEAALFAGDLLRMYLRYAEARRWNMEVMSESQSEQGGYREVVVRVVGRKAYARLKFESGGHRVQRVPETESQGRIHTSACTVAVLPELEDVSEVEIDSSDLKVDTFRASGAGGQHVNKTDSAIRITHLPTGMVVECQDERSQHKNRARALSLLHARLLAAERDRQAAERAAERRLLVGSGDRSQRIRTYNFPQGRITDHRIHLTLYRLEAVLHGDLDPLIDPLMSAYQADQLAAMGLDG